MLKLCRFWCPAGLLLHCERVMADGDSNAAASGPFSSPTPGSRGPGGGDGVCGGVAEPALDDDDDDDDVVSASPTAPRDR